MGCQQGYVLFSFRNPDHGQETVRVCFGILRRKSHSLGDIYNGRDNGLLMNKSVRMAPGELAAGHWPAWDKERLLTQQQLEKV